VSGDRPEPADQAEARQSDTPSAAPQRRRRGYRRATGGTAPAGTDAPGRAPDDTDLGWNEPTRDDDERILREKPPHW
jgi:hypothetical protein